MKLDRDVRPNRYNSRYTAHEHELIPTSRVVEIGMEIGDLGVFNGRHHYQWRDLYHGNDYRALLMHIITFRPASI